MTGSLLDVCLALLLVSAAAVTLVGADAGPDPGPSAGVAGSERAEEAAAVLTATTAAVNYTLVGADDGVGGASRPDARRVAHGTLAEHLARAAVRSATVDGTALSPATAGYRRAVRAAVADAVRPRTEVRAVWRPLPGSGVSGGFRVGSPPPATASVSAARFAIPVPDAFAAAPGIDTGGTGSDADGSRNARNARNARYPAAAAVAILFPPKRIAAAARGDPPVPGLVEDRYRRAGDALGVDAVERFREGSPAAANEILARTLATRTGRRSAVGAGTGADTATGPVERTRTVVVVVRVWSP